MRLARLMEHTGKELLVEKLPVELFFFVKSDLRLKQSSVMISFFFKRQIKGEIHWLWKLVETQIKVKVIVCVEVLEG